MPTLVGPKVGNITSAKQKICWLADMLRLSRPFMFMMLFVLTQNQVLVRCHSERLHLQKASEGKRSSRGVCLND